MQKRLISFLLVLGMIISLVPVSALADEVAPEAVFEEALASAEAVDQTDLLADEIVAIMNQALADAALADELIESANDEMSGQAEIAQGAIVCQRCGRGGPEAGGDCQ